MAQTALYDLLMERGCTINRRTKIISFDMRNGSRTEVAGMRVAETTVALDEIAYLRKEIDNLHKALSLANARNTPQPVSVSEIIDADKAQWNAIHKRWDKTDPK